jgi:hypothetical protein
METVETEHFRLYHMVLSVASLRGRGIAVKYSEASPQLVSGVHYVGLTPSALCLLHCYL